MKDAKKKDEKKGWICPICKRGCSPELKHCECVALSPREVHHHHYYPPVYPHLVPYRYAPLPATPWIYGSCGIGYNDAGGYTVAQAGDGGITNLGGTFANNAGTTFTIGPVTIDSFGSGDDGSGSAGGGGNLPQ